MPECVLCKKGVQSLEHDIEHLVMELIKKEHKEWVESDGACPKCVEYYDGLDDMVEVQ